MTALPSDLQDVRDQIARADEAGDVMAASVTDAQFHWQPRGGAAWSIAQCLEHLGAINEVYGASIRAGVELARSKGWRRKDPIRSTIFGRHFITSLEPPVRRRLPAPTVARPGSTRARAEILTLYRDSHRKILDLIAACTDLDVNRATFQNPFLRFVKVRVGTAFRIVAAHDRRHLWQAERVKNAEGYPA